MPKHTQPDPPILAAFVGAHQARAELAELHGAAVRAQTEGADIARAVERTTFAAALEWPPTDEDSLRREASDRALLEQTPDALLWPFELEQADTCTEPGCGHLGVWFMPALRRPTYRPGYRRLCTRDAARSIRGPIPTTRRDQTR